MNDKFVYKEAELKTANSQCEFCVYYNDGKFSANCPTEKREDIAANRVGCDCMDIK